jgi:antirestriction protein ArdC
MSVYEIITDEIIKRLESGVVPWQKPVRGMILPPMNFKSKKRYRGVNCLLLSNKESMSPYWLTYNQAKELDGEITKGSKGTRIVFSKLIEKEKNNEIVKVPIFRYSYVFNLNQIKNIECPYKKELDSFGDFEYIENCQNLLSRLDEEKKIPKIEEVYDKRIACYNVSKDIIFTIPKKHYVTSEKYYSVMFHEIIHSTGHLSRLNRITLTENKDENYAKEELVAEIGASFLCGVIGIITDTIENSSAYIDNWLKRIRNDKTLVITAASKAQEAVDWLNVYDDSIDSEILIQGERNG